MTSFVVVTTKLRHRHDPERVFMSFACNPTLVLARDGERPKYFTNSPFGPSLDRNMRNAALVQSDHSVVSNVGRYYA